MEGLSDRNQKKEGTLERRKRCTMRSDSSYTHVIAVEVRNGSHKVSKLLNDNFWEFDRFWVIFFLCQFFIKLWQFDNFTDFVNRHGVGLDDAVFFTCNIFLPFGGFATGHYLLQNALKDLNIPFD